MHSDMPEDADDDDYLPPEGVQSTLMPHDLHDTPVLSPDLQDVSSALEGGEGLEVVDNPEQAEAINQEAQMDSEETDTPVAPAGGYGGGRYPARIRGVGVPM